MGQKNSKGTVSILKENNRIRLRWRYLTKRYSLSLFHYSKANLIEVKKIALSIEIDMLRQCFDTTLLKYNPHIIPPPVSKQQTITEQFENWVKQYRNMDCDKDQDYYVVRNMFRRWGNFNAKDVVGLLAKEKINERTYNRRLSLLKCFYTWLVKQKQFRRII